MAGLCTYYNLAFVKENNFTERVSIKGSNNFTLFLTIFWAQTHTFAQISAFTSGPDMYTKKNL